jgi:hypothetical protein
MRNRYNADHRICRSINSITPNVIKERVISITVVIFLLILMFSSPQAMLVPIF